MKPYEIISKLKTLKTDKAKDNLLDGLDEVDAFWSGAFYGLSVFTPYRHQVNAQNPSEYGTGAPSNVFGMIVTAMEQGRLSEIDYAAALTAFSRACTEEEWTQWYKPIVEKKLDLGISLDQFNSFCPPEFKIVLFELPTRRVLKEIKRLIPSFYMEPYPGDEAEQIFIFVTKESIKTYKADGTRFGMSLPKDFLKVAGDDGPVVFEAALEDSTVVLRDVLLFSQVMKMELSAPCTIRMKVLTDLYHQYLASHKTVSLPEMYPCEDSAPEESREVFARFIQQGFTGAYIRPLDSRYYDDHSTIVVEPKRKSILTCTKIIEGKDDSEYKGRMEYLKGSGTMNKKKFETLIFHGLTNDDRSTCLEHSKDYVGRKFEVVSCGLDKRDNLIFPVFKEWRK
jgi:hypothetical protein